MLEKLKYFSVPLLLLTTAVSASAHSPQQEGKVQTFGYKQDIDSTSVYGTLHQNAPETFQIPGVPSMALIGKGGKFIIGLGGFVKAVVGVDLGHPIPSADEFITSQIPMQPMDGDGARFNLSAKQSHLFVNFVILPGSENQIGAFVSANFLNDYMPVLQFAYLKYRGFQGGYDYSLFSDPACGGPAVDYEGPCSNTANPVAGLSYTFSPKYHRQWEFSLGVELPQTSFTTVEGKTRSVSQRVPDVPVAIRYSWGKGASWVRASAILRNLYYRDIPAARNVDKLSYGFQVSGAWVFQPKFTLFWQGVWGKGIGSMIQDTVGEGLDLTPSEDGEGLDPVMLWGGFASLLYDISDRFCSSVTYSQLRTYAPRFAGGETPWNDLYKYAQYVSANVFFHATSFFDIGLEYIWGRRTNYSGLKCADNRLQAAFQLSF